MEVRQENIHAFVMRVMGNSLVQGARVIFAAVIRRIPDWDDLARHQADLDSLVRVCREFSAEISSGLDLLKHDPALYREALRQGHELLAELCKEGIDSGLEVVLAQIDFLPRDSAFQPCRVD